MARPLPLLLSIAAGFAAASACYSERLAPPTFRYSCSSDGDCNADERCLGGLCQVPCTQLTFDDVCTQQNHLACFNGVCSTGCVPSEDENPCPSSQTCIDVGLSASGGSFVSSGSEMMIGICGSQCTEGSCPEGEDCVEGVCITTCTSTAECPGGTVCFAGFCVPEDFVPADADDGSGTNADGESSTAGDSDATTATTTTGGAT